MASIVPADTALAHAWRTEALVDLGQYAQVGGWHIDAVQTSPGALDCMRRELTLDGLQWLDEDLRNASIHLFGTPPAGSMVFGVLLRGEASARINGWNWCRNELAVGSADGPVEILLPPARVATLWVRHSLMADYLWHRDAVRLDDQALNVRRTLLRTPQLTETTRRRLLSLSDAVATREAGMAWSEAQARAFRGEILDVLADVVVADVGIQRVPIRRNMHVEVVRQARRHIEECTSDSLQVEDLCRVTRVSRSTLQRCFTSVVGVTPVHYLRLSRLGRARRMLFELRPGQHIQDILGQLGIWHASRFAAEYRELFGELPSETLRRKRQQHSSVCS